MKKNRWFRYLMLAAIFALFTVGFSTISGGAAPVEKSVLPPTELLSGDETGEKPEFSQLLTSKKETDAPLRTTGTVDQFNELRYLQLGNMDQEIALFVKLVDKAKAGIINTTGLVRLLRQRQTRNRGGDLEQQIDNLIYELCILDLGKSSRRDLLDFMDELDFNDSEFGSLVDKDSSNFKSIIELIRYNILSPMEAIDSLIILKSKLMY